MDNAANGVPAGRLVFCSHRGPVTFRDDGDGLVAVPATPGGLVQAVGPAFRQLGAHWIFAAIGQHDRAAASTREIARLLPDPRLHMLVLPEVAHNQHYQTVTTGHLAQTFHYLFNLSETPSFGDEFKQAWAGYQTVNSMFAKAAEGYSSSADATAISVPDLHLMLVAGRLTRGAHARSLPKLYFHHVPWCEPDYLGILPTEVRDEILAGLLAFDLVGFHSSRWAAAFLRCCDRYLPGAEVSDEGVVWREETARVLAAPAQLDAAKVRALARDERTDAWVATLRELQADRRTLIRVDRVDQWKNVLRGFEAFDLMLRREPTLAGNLWFLAILSPTRAWLADYREYFRVCLATAESINERHTRLGRMAPITVLAEPATAVSDLHRVYAGLRIADAVLVNPLYDGLNLVAKEAVLVGESSPALIVSRNAGVYEEFADAAIGINPFDLTETASAMEQALTMPGEERRARFQAMQRLIEGKGPIDWVQRQIEAATDNVAASAGGQ